MSSPWGLQNIKLQKYRNTLGLHLRYPWQKLKLRHSIICCYFLYGTLTISGGRDPQSDEQVSTECLWQGRDPNNTKSPT